MKTGDSSSTSPFKIDNHCSSWQFKFSYYHILVTKTSTIKCLATPDPGPSFPDIRGEGLGFEAVLKGDWNIGYLTRATCEDKYFLPFVEKKEALAAIETIWHPCKTDCLAFGEPDHYECELQLTNRIFSGVYTDHFSANKVIVITDWSPE